jgi:hypothetical protein
MIKTWLLVAALVLGPGSSAWAQEAKLPLVDEAAGDASWLQFKKRLQTAIDKRDTQFLLSILDKDIRNQGAKDRGVAQFRRQWELDTADSPVWRELQVALQLGSAYLNRDKGPREVCVPYVLGKWPPDFHPFENGVIVTRETIVQAEPSSASASLGVLAYDIVRVEDWEIDDKSAAKQKWVRIKFHNRDGYVPEEHIRSPIEQAACFVKSGSAWRMTAFAPAGGE